MKTLKESNNSSISSDVMNVFFGRERKISSFLFSRWNLKPILHREINVSTFISRDLDHEIYSGQHIKIGDMKKHDKIQ